MHVGMRNQYICSTTTTTTAIECKHYFHYGYHAIKSLSVNFLLSKTCTLSNIRIGCTVVIPYGVINR